MYIAEEDLEPAEVTTDTIILAGQGAKEVRRCHSVKSGARVLPAGLEPAGGLLTRLTDPSYVCLFLCLLASRMAQWPRLLRLLAESEQSCHMLCRAWGRPRALPSTMVTRKRIRASRRLPRGGGIAEARTAAALRQVREAAPHPRATRRPAAPSLLAPVQVQVRASAPRRLHPPRRKGDKRRRPSPSRGSSAQTGTMLQARATLLSASCTLGACRSRGMLGGSRR